jgi:hypothetical protein
LGGATTINTTSPKASENIIDTTVLAAFQVLGLLRKHQLVACDIAQIRQKIFTLVVGSTLPY